MNMLNCNAWCSDAAVACIHYQCLTSRGWTLPASFN